MKYDNPFNENKLSKSASKKILWKWIRKKKVGLGKLWVVKRKIISLLKYFFLNDYREGN